MLQGSFRDPPQIPFKTSTDLTCARSLGQASRLCLHLPELIGHTIWVALIQVSLWCLPCTVIVYCCLARQKAKSNLERFLWDFQQKKKLLWGAAEFWNMLLWNRHLENPVTSLKNESRPFFLGDSRIWSFPSFLSLAITAFGAPECF